MKIFTRMLLVLMFSSIICAQVTKTILRKPTFNGDVREFSVVGNTMYMLGYNININPGISFVAKSTDEGVSWIPLPSPFGATDYLTAMSFPTLNTGYVAGANGKLYKTTNGGQTWINKTDSATYSSQINCLFFLTPDSGYFCGNGTTIIYKTTNGGDSWTPITTPVTNSANHMLWQTFSKGWVVCNSSKILYTTDAGATWLVSTPGVGTLYRIRQTSPEVFYVSGGAGTGALSAKSTDGGVNWNLTALPPSNLQFFTCEYIDTKVGYVMGSGGVVYKTTDGGGSWTVQPPFTNEVIRTSIIAYGKIYAGAYKSNIFVTPLDNTSWTSLTEDQRDIYGIYAESSSSLAMAADRGNAYISSNGGVNWKMTSLLPGTLLYDVYRNGSNLYVCGQTGAYYYSGNSGATWSNTFTGTSTTKNYKLYFRNANTGYMSSNDGTIYYTTNRGQTWTLKNTISGAILYDIKAVSDSVLYTVGAGQRIYKSTDGGDSWTHNGLAQPAGQMLGLYMLSENTGFVCGENGAVYKTTNGFQSVTLLTDTNAWRGRTMHDVIAFNESNVWAAGTNGVIFRSDNSGQMTFYDSTGYTIYSMAKLTERSFVTAGANGMVVKIEWNVVPVELSSFSAQRGQEGITFSWSTASETNNRGFEIQASADKYNWSALGFTQSRGSTSASGNYSFQTNKIADNLIYFRLKQIDFDGSIHFSKIIEVSGAPENYSLAQNYPNPFNPSTTISYEIGAAGIVSLRVFDVLGNQVATLINGFKPAGRHDAVFSASALSGGVYYYQLNANGFTATRKLILIK